jgi:hypothetical protein
MHLPRPLRRLLALLLVALFPATGVAMPLMATSGGDGGTHALAGHAAQSDHSHQSHHGSRAPAADCCDLCVAACAGCGIAFGPAVSALPTPGTRSAPRPGRSPARVESRPPHLLPYSLGPPALRA